MENIELAKLIVKQVEAEPESFDMKWYGISTSCGTAACLAGHAMLLSGYTFDGANFFRPDGSQVAKLGSSEEREASMLLGLSDDEEFPGSGKGAAERYRTRLFSELQEEAVALARFKALIEASERD